MAVGRGSGTRDRLGWSAGLPFREVDDGEHAHVVSTLAEAFGDDPFHRWLFPDEGSRSRCLVEFFSAAVDWTATHGGLVMASPGYECVYTVHPPAATPPRATCRRCARGPT